MSNQYKRTVEAIVMVPHRVRFESANTGPQLREEAHRTVTVMNSVDGFQPKLMCTRIVEEPECPKPAA